MSFLLSVLGSSPAKIGPAPCGLANVVPNLRTSRRNCPSAKIIRDHRRFSDPALQLCFLALSVSGLLGWRKVLRAPTASAAATA